MATRQKSEKKTARSSDGDNEEGINPKRHCTTSTRATTSTTTSVSVKQEEEELEVAGGSNISNNNPLVTQAALPDSVTSATETNNAATTTTTDDDDDIDNNELPTPVELSKKLCRIVDTDHYSRAEACRALDKLCQWAVTEDPEYLKYFHIHGGIVKVLDFLKATMNDLSCVGTVRMKCIENAAGVIARVCCSGEDGSNIEIVAKITTSALDYNVINTLLSASDEYSGGDDVARLQALDEVWAAMMNISSLNGIVINQDQAILVFEAGIDILSQLKLYDGPIVSSKLLVVFVTLSNVVRRNYVDKKHFQNKNILSKSLEVFRKDGIWGDRNETITNRAIYLFYDCHKRKLLEDSEDYEMILPFLAVGLKKFGSNPDSNDILKNAIKLIRGACDSINEKKVIEQSGVMEPLVVLLASNDINEDQKQKVREVIGKITAP